MIDRLLFGCGHLVGGASQRQADRLITRCLDAGVRWFDTAPLYGLGTAEAALATALRRDGRMALVSVKVGLARPRHGVLKSFVRAGMRGLTRRRRQDDRSIAPPNASDPGLPRGHFEPDAIARSFEETRDRLGGVASIRALFLHEAYADNLTAEAVGAVRRLKALNGIRDIGLANGCLYSTALEALAPPDFLIQSAAPPCLFDQSEVRSTDRRILHSVIKSFRSRRAADAPFRSAVESTRERFAGFLGDGGDAEIALAYVLLAHAAPHARFVYASADRRRLEAFLAAMTAIGADQIDPVIAFFQSAHAAAADMAGSGGRPDEGELR